MNLSARIMALRLFELVSGAGLRSDSAYVMIPNLCYLTPAHHVAAAGSTSSRSAAAVCTGAPRFSSPTVRGQETPFSTKLGTLDLRKASHNETHQLGTQRLHPRRAGQCEQLASRPQRGVRRLHRATAGPRAYGRLQQRLGQPREQAQ